MEKVHTSSVMERFTKDNLETISKQVIALSSIQMVTFMKEK